MKLSAATDWLRYFSGLFVAIFCILSLTDIALPEVNTDHIIINPSHLTIHAPTEYRNDLEVKALNSNKIFQSNPSITITPIIRLDKIQIGLIQNFSVRNHQLFLLGSYGLAIVDLNQKETQIKKFNYTPVGIDNSSRIWFITNNSDSIFQWDGQSTTEYGKAQGWILPLNLFNSPLPTQNPSFITDDHIIWLATSKDIRFFNGRLWRIFTASEIGIRLPYKSGIESAFTINRNPATRDIWVGACYWQGTQWIGGSAPYQFDGNTWKRGSFPEENICVTSIVFTSDGSGYLITPDRLWKYNGKEWMEISLSFIQNLPQNTTYQIRHFGLDNFETPWLVVHFVNLNGLITRYELLQFEKNILNPVSTFEGFATPQIYHTSTGATISIRNNQIFQLSHTGWIKLTEQKFDLSAQDNYGNIWLISETKNRPLLWKLQDQRANIQGMNQ